MKYCERDDDDQFGYDRYEDVVAHTGENEFYGLKLGSDKLSDLDMIAIAEVSNDLVSNGSFKIEFSRGPVDLPLSESEYELENYFSEIPGIVGIRESVDDGPGNSESWTVFLIEDGANPSFIEADIQALFEKLKGYEKRAYALLGY